MWTRTQLKIGWLDLPAGAISTVYGADRNELARDAEIERAARVIEAIAQRVGSSRTCTYAGAAPETERGAEAPQ